MSAIAAALKYMLAAGMPHDQIVAAVAEMESSLVRPETPEERRKRVSRESSARYRERVRDGKTSPNVTKRHQNPVTQSDENTSPVTEKRHQTTPLARVEDKTLTTEASAKIDDVEGLGARDPNDWPEGDARAHAAQLVELAATSNLDPARSPTLITSMGRLAQWRRDGASWDFDVVPVVTMAAKRTRKPIGSWTFFDRAIAQSIADNRAALSIPEASNVTPFARGPPSFIEQDAAIKAEARRRLLAQET